MFQQLDLYKTIKNIIFVYKKTILLKGKVLVRVYLWRY